MPILVLCTGCGAKFHVSDKFAGKTGPCPKCKTTISIPATAMAPEGEIKVHEPEQYAEGGRDVRGRLITKPIPRHETRITLVGGSVMIAAVAGMLAVAWFGRPQLQNMDMGWIRAAALWLASIPVSRACYALLFDEELEPHKGLALWIRSAICGTIYAALWGMYWVIPADMTQEAWNWFFIAPPIVLVGTLAALWVLDLDLGSAFFHYSFYLLCTLALGFAAGLQMPWVGVTATL